MAEIAQEECERAEYAKITMEFRSIVLGTTYGKLLFRPSKVKRHFDLFASKNDCYNPRLCLKVSRLAIYRPGKRHHGDRNGFFEAEYGRSANPGCRSHRYDRN